MKKKKDETVVECFERRKNEIKQQRIRREEKLKRDIESGLVNGVLYPNGSYIVYKPKGIQNQHDTRKLVEEVTKIMDRFEEMGHGRICPINGKWMLQIRGKHLRRLLKKMPNVKQKGRYLVQEKEN